jgi:hypothetical protein
MARITPNQSDRQNEAKAAELARQREAANRQRATQTPAPAPKTVLDIINQASTFKPGIPQSIKAPTQSLTLPSGPTPDFSRGTYNVVPASSNSNAAAQAAAQAAANAAAQAAANAAAQAAAQASAQAAIDEANRKRAEQEERDRQAAAAAAEQARQEAIARMPKPLVVSAREPVKYATPSDVLIDINDLPVDLILKLTLEKIGGLELISLVRHDTVNGQNIVYRPIKNISQLAIDYNPQNMVKMPDSADSYFKNFPIKLENHIQQTTNELPPLVAYIDSATENVIIDVVNIKADYEIEVQMVSSGKVFDATIYMEDYSS